MVIIADFYWRHKLIRSLLMSAAELPQPLDSSAVMEFHGASYVEVKLSNNVAKTFAYEIWFLPTKADGKLTHRVHISRKRVNISEIRSGASIFSDTFFYQIQHHLTFQKLRNIGLP